MDDSLKQHLTTVVIVSLVGIATCAFALMQVHDAAGSMSVETFSFYIIMIPTVVMVVASLVIMATANRIGRQLFLVVVGICFVMGLISMVVTSIWMADATIAEQLLANSGEGATVTPVTSQPIIALRDIAAYIVAPTVGSILGAWIGSRIHPMESDKPVKGKKGKRS